MGLSVDLHFFITSLPFQNQSFKSLYLIYHTYSLCLYSAYGCSLLQACIKIQTFFRIYLAMVHKEKYYIRYVRLSYHPFVISVPLGVIMVKLKSVFFLKKLVINGISIGHKMFLQTPLLLIFSLNNRPIAAPTYSYLSMRQAGKGVILELATQDLKRKVEKIIKAEQIARTSVSTPLISSCTDIVTGPVHSILLFNECCDDVEDSVRSV